ncbi:hypothetical protein ORV05_25650 [Amycolatopsis cynarae]|uniref:Uncharacterized protein n=1 Tax=Amycolatopsis cynarae TaxID=2995223 RepID=A0ABY7AX81_9PSEU|nr:hypothetical protein [Amycolatopsis sp. HUAS 11-8]WAL64332.1 hypothetical protein ORV05_25650 [Amycolatopsis sp. HUAS 11-8]
MIRSGLDENLGPAVPCGRFRHAHRRRHHRGARGGPARHRGGGTDGRRTDRASGSSTGLIDSIDTPLSFDPLAPGYSVQGAGGGSGPLYRAQPGAGLLVTRHAASAAQDTVGGLLVLDLHNGAGTRDTVVRLHSGGRPS